MKCPDCSGNISGKGSHYTCDVCGTKWKVKFTCEVCGNLPSVASGCGSVSFYCETCGTLKSRESMDKEFSKDN